MYVQFFARNLTYTNWLLRKHRWRLCEWCRLQHRSRMPFKFLQIWTRYIYYFCFDIFGRAKDWLLDQCEFVHTQTSLRPILVPQIIQLFDLCGYNGESYVTTFLVHLPTWCAASRNWRTYTPQVYTSIVHVHIREISRARAIFVYMYAQIHMHISIYVNIRVIFCT